MKETADRRDESAAGDGVSLTAETIPTKGKPLTRMNEGSQSL